MRHEEPYGLPGIHGPLFGDGASSQPFDNSKTKPTPQEELIANIIWKHRGRANPVSIEDIQVLTGYTERQIKAIVEQLVVAHQMKIGACREEPAGYFVIHTAEDLAAAVKPYKAQIIAMWRRLRVLESKPALRELLGQLRLEEGNGEY